MKALDKPDAIKTVKELIASRLQRSDLADVLIDIDNRTNFLSHFLPPGTGTVERRRDALAAVLAIGCNIGMPAYGARFGLKFREISFVADSYLTDETLKSASIDKISRASRLGGQARHVNRCLRTSVLSPKFGYKIERRIRGFGRQFCAR